MHFVSPPDLIKPAISRPHGTRVNYKSGCPCLLCRAANARYEAKRAAARAAGDWNALVSAQAARRHINSLSRRGIGRRALAAASDVAESVISQIRSGRQKKIRKRTESRILAVSAQAPSDGALIGAKATWRQIETLLAEGFSRAELARRLGYRSPSLQIGKNRIRARTAARIDRLFRTLMRE